MPSNIEYNLSARFMFRGAAGTAQMKKTSRAFKSLQRSAMMAKAGVQQIGSGMRTLSMAGIAVGAALIGVVKQSAAFNKQMSVVKSVVQPVGKEMAKLRGEALRLGASTSFSSMQAAEGMEHLARSGFTATQVIRAISPALRMAEADTMELATATKIVAAQVKAFGLGASEAQGISDVLAYTSARTATNVTELGEALKYSAATASAANQTYQDTIGALGLLANIGIRGSLAGTALKNAFLKLTRMTKASQKLFDGKDNLLKVLTYGAGPKKGQMRPLHLVIMDTIMQLKKIPNSAERSAAAFKIFGLRGKAMMDALNVAKKEDFAKVFDNMGVKAKGMAMKMSKMRLDNLAGDWIIFKSAAQNAAIALGSYVEPELRKIFGRVSGNNGLIKKIQDLSSAFTMMGKEGTTQAQVAEKYGSTIAQIVFGFKEGFNEAKETIIETTVKIKAFFQEMGGGGKDSVKNITKMITKFSILAAAITPIVVGLGAMGMVGGAAFNVIGGGLKTVTALASPFGAVMFLVMNAFAGAHQAGESMVKRMARGAKNMTQAFHGVLKVIGKISEALGPMTTLVLGLGAIMGGKMAIRGIGGALAGKGGMLGRVAGASGAAGMPVYVTNWPMGMQVPGGRSAGMAGNAATAAGAVPSAASSRGASFFSRLKQGAVGTAGMMGMGGMGGGGAAGAAGGGGATGAAGAALGSTLAGAAVTVGFFAAALAPAIGGLYELGQAYDKEAQAKKRRDLMSSTKVEREQMAWLREKVRKAQVHRGIGDTSGDKSLYDVEKRQKSAQYRKVYKVGPETLKQIHAASAMFKRGGSKNQMKALNMMETLNKWRRYNKKGDTSALEALSPDKLLQFFQIKADEAAILKKLADLSDRQIKELEQGRAIKVYLNGKEIAGAVQTTKGNNKERGGRGKKRKPASEVVGGRG